MSLPRHESPQRIPPAFIMAIMIMITLAVSLGGVRLYSLYLEYRLSDINAKIDAEVSKKVQLEIRLASLLSPERIYSNARARLGMEARRDFVKIALPWAGGGQAPSQVERQALRAESGGRSRWGWTLNFAGEAHAKD